MPSPSIRMARAACALALGLAAALAPWGGRAAADGPVRIRLATLAPRGSSFHQLLLAMGERWRQASGGRVALTVFPDGTMGGEADVVRRMRVGQLQAGMLTVVGLSEIDAAVNVLAYVPLVFRSLDEVDFVRERMAPMLEARLEAKGFVVLFWGDAGWVRFFSRTPATRPSDFKRVRIFVWSGESEQADVMKRVGYQPVLLEPTDILPGLQTGLIGAVPAVPYFALASQLYGPASHMLELNWAPLVGATVVAKRAWDALPAGDREALRAAARETGQAIKARSRAEADEAVETMKARGLTVHALTPETEAEWRAFAEEMYLEVRGRLVPADLFDELRRLVREYRASHGDAEE